jgi:hypothetical protein
MHISPVGGLVHGASNSHTLTSYVCVKNGDGEASFQGCHFYVGLSPHIDKLHQAQKTMEVFNLKYGLLVMVGVSQCVCVFLS